MDNSKTTQFTLFLVGALALLTKPIFLADADIHVFSAWSSDPDLDAFPSLVLAVDVSLLFKQTRTLLTHFQTRWTLVMLKHQEK